MEGNAGRTWPSRRFISLSSTSNNSKVVSVPPRPLGGKEMEFDLVIKVKYGETLRRFNAYGTGNILHLNMDELRAKIINLFNLKPEAHFNLTYIDDDGDIVMLIDDADLWDAAISQHLNPLRIDVQFTTSVSGKPRKSSLEDSVAPRWSPHLRTQLRSCCTGHVNEAMGTKQHPFHDALLKPSGASVAPLTEFVGSLSTLGLSCLYLLSHGQDGVTLPTPGIGIASNSMDLNTTIRSEVSSDSIATSKEQATINFVDQPPSINLKDLNNGLAVGDDSAALVSISKDAARVCEDDNIHHDRNAEEVASAPLVDHLMGCNQHASSESTKSSHHIIQSTDALDAAENKTLANGTCYVASGLVSSDNKSPMDNQLEVASSTGIPPPVTHPFKMPSNHCNKILTHQRKVQCNACEMKPVVGPRFKSKVKQDYNLCNVCFSKMGNDADYTRIDCAVSWSSQLHKKCNNNNMSSHVQLFCRLNLDSSFVQDVTIADGTRMAPLTPFTKIWRMRNSGTVFWPSTTQLVWIGGDQFGDRSSVDLVIPKNGYPVGEELDIAVDFTAPSSPGKYISYWTMALPSGQKFGQHIWGLIKVSESQDDSSVSSSHASLNLPHGISGKKGKGINILDVNEAKGINIMGVDEGKGLNIDANIESLDTGHEEVKPTFYESPRMKEELNLEADCGGLIAANGAVKAEPPIEASVPPVQVTEPRVMLPLPCEPEVNEVEQVLLKELEEMGFQQSDLNKDILRLNNYNLEQSLEDLCNLNN